LPRLRPRPARWRAVLRPSPREGAGREGAEEMTAEGARKMVGRFAGDAAFPLLLADHRLLRDSPFALRDRRPSLGAEPPVSWSGRFKNGLCHRLRVAADRGRATRRHPRAGAVLMMGWLLSRAGLRPAAALPAGDWGPGRRAGPCRASGSAMIYSTSLSIVSNAFSPEERGAGSALDGDRPDRLGIGPLGAGGGVLTEQLSLAIVLLRKNIPGGGHWHRAWRCWWSRNRGDWDSDGAPGVGPAGGFVLSRPALVFPGAGVPAVQRVHLRLAGWLIGSWRRPSCCSRVRPGRAPGRTRRRCASSKLFDSRDYPRGLRGRLPWPTTASGSANFFVHALPPEHF